VNYYLKTSSSSYIGHRYINNLAAGAYNNQNTYLGIPTNITKGNYYLLACADAGRNVLKSNETNNYRFSSTKIQIIGPDYILFNNKIGGDVTKNKEINNNIPKTDFAKTIFRLEKSGSIMLKFGDNIGLKVLISAGIHGNEAEANIAIMKYLELIKDKNIKETLYIIPFALPIDTSLNTRYYNGKDPNRIANVVGTPGWNIVQFARKNGIKNILDVHSGGGVTSNGLINVNPSKAGSPEYKWASYITKVSGCTSRFQPLEKGMVRTEAFNYGINTITFEVMRDGNGTKTASETEFKMINVACKYLGFPSMY
jgi:predicted deacylase